MDDVPSSAPRRAGWPRPFQNLATCASPLRDADGRATTHRLAGSRGGVDDGEPRAREGSGPRRAGATCRATDDADATRADICAVVRSGGGSELPCGRVLLASWQRRSRSGRQRRKKLQPTQTRGAARLMTQKVYKVGRTPSPAVTHANRSAPRHSSTRPRDVTKARIERHPTLASYEANPASNVRLLTRPALGTCSRDPASAVPSRPAPAAPFRRTPDRRRSHLFPQVIRLKRDTERSK